MEMAQWVKMIAFKLDDLCPIPGTHTVEEEKQLLQAVLLPPFVSCGRQTDAQTHAHTEKIKVNEFL